VYEHRQEKMTGTSKIHAGKKLMISLRPEAYDCIGAHFWALCPVKVSAM
jgi:hypothetical protein